MLNQYCAAAVPSAYPWLEVRLRIAMQLRRRR